MKKFIAMCLAVLLLLGCIGCAEERPEPKSKPHRPTEAQTQQSEPETELETEPETEPETEVLAEVVARVVPDDDNSYIINDKGEAVLKMNIDSVYVDIPGNIGATQKIMDASKKEKELVYDNAQDIAGSMSPGRNNEMFEEYQITILRADRRIISWSSADTIFLDGTRPIHGAAVRTFSSETGDELQFGDLTDQKEALKKALRDACWEQANSKQDDPNSYGYEDIVSDEENFDHIFSEENFDWGLADDGIYIYCIPNMIGSFAGEVEFVVPYDLIADSVYDWVLPE